MFALSKCAWNFLFKIDNKVKVFHCQTVDPGPNVKLLIRVQTSPQVRKFIFFFIKVSYMPFVLIMIPRSISDNDCTLHYKFLGFLLVYL